MGARCSRCIEKNRDAEVKQSSISAKLLPRLASAGERSMLLLIDFQPIILDGLKGRNRSTCVLNAANEAITKASMAGATIVYVRMAFEQGHPEIGNSNPIFNMIKASNLLVNGTDEAALDPRLTFVEGSPVFTTSRVSPFFSTPLAAFIEEQNISEVAIGGVSGAAVLAAVRECFDRDLDVTLLRDCCEDRIEFRNQTCINDIISHEANVANVEDWSPRLSAGTLAQPISYSRAYDHRSAKAPEMTNARTHKPLLVLMDFQSGILAGISKSSVVLDAANRAINAAKQADVPIALVRLAFQPDHPEVVERKRLFGAVNSSSSMIDGTEAAALHPGLAVPENAYVFTKTCVSPLGTSMLKEFIHEHQFTHVVLGGVSSGAVVLSAVREFFDLDLDITVLRDCCADRVPARHVACMEQVFPSDGKLMSVEAWSQTL